MLKARRVILVKGGDGYTVKIELGESGSIEVVAEEGLVVDVERIMREKEPDTIVRLGRGERVRVDGLVFERSGDDKLVIYAREE